MSIYKGNSLVAGGSQVLPLLTFIWSDCIKNHPSWLRADSFSWQSGAVYQAAYAHLADDITGKTLQSETISGTTIQFYLADDGHKICPASQESNVTAIYNATGVAWYYIIDTTNQRFKLPRTKFGFTGIRTGVGNYVEAGLPNITGSISGLEGDSLSSSGAIQHTTWYGGEGGGSRAWVGITFDASRSSSIYGNSDTVQPKATEMYLYFYVGNFTQTALENTAGLNAELFNGKADVSTVAHVVTEFQEPTSANGYTWYRKYADGWVEQGGKYLNQAASGSNTVTLLVTMADTNYCLITQRIKPATSAETGNEITPRLYNVTTTSFGADLRISNGNTSTTVSDWCWQVSGMAAN